MTEGLTTGSEDPNEVPVEEGTNILREKTFTPELRELVSRISNNEDSDTETADMVTGIKTASRGPNELLRDLHQLFYEVKFSEAIDSTPPTLRQIRQILETDDSENLMAMNDILTALIPGYDGFAVFRLDIDAGAYVPVMQNHGSEIINGLSIGLHDKLFGELQKPETIVSASEPESALANGMLSRYLSDNGGKSVTFVALNYIFDQGSPEGPHAKERVSTGHLVMALSCDSDFAGEKGILSILKRECIYHLLLLFADFQFPEESSGVAMASLQEIIKELEVLRQRTSTGHGGIILLIRGAPGKDLYAAFSFLMVKLQRLTGEESVVIRIWSEVALCMVTPSEIPVIEILIKEFNKTFDNTFHLKRIDDRDVPGIAFLLEDILT